MSRKGLRAKSSLSWSFAFFLVVTASEYSDNFHISPLHACQVIAIPKSNEWKFFSQRFTTLLQGPSSFPTSKESVRFVNHSYGNDSVHALCFTSKRDDQLRNSECGQLLRSIQVLVVHPTVIKNNINFRETRWCWWWCTMTDRVISLRSDEKSWEILRKKKSWPTVPNEPRD